MLFVLPLKILLEVSDFIMALAWGDCNATFPPQFKKIIEEKEERLRWEAVCHAFTQARMHLLHYAIDSKLNFPISTFVQRPCIFVFGLFTTLFSFGNGILFSSSCVSFKSEDRGVISRLATGKRDFESVGRVGFSAHFWRANGDWLRVVH